MCPHEGAGRFVRASQVGRSPERLSVRWVAASHVGIMPVDARFSHKWAIQFRDARLIRLPLVVSDRTVPGGGDSQLGSEN